MRSQRQYLRDIIEAMDAAERFVEDVAFEGLEGNLERQYALQRAFEIIGEATKQIASEIRERYSEVPWAHMAGRRDVLIHQYFAVHLKTVWATIHERFPPIQGQIVRILDELPPDT